MKVTEGVPGLDTWTGFCGGLHTSYTAGPSRGRRAGWRWCCACRCDTWRAPGSAAPSRTATGIQRCTHIWRWSAPGRRGGDENNHTAAVRKKKAIRFKTESAKWFKKKVTWVDKQSRCALKWAPHRDQSIPPSVWLMWSSQSQAPHL